MKSKFDPQKHHRRSIRLKNYDYSWAGAYYVTIVTWHRDILFGKIVNGEMILNRAGKIVLAEWLELSKRLGYVQLGAFIIMPNHIHFIIFIRNESYPSLPNKFVGDVLRQNMTDPGASPKPRGPQLALLAAIVGQFKSRGRPGIWQTFLLWFAIQALRIGYAKSYPFTQGCHVI